MPAPRPLRTFIVAGWLLVIVGAAMPVRAAAPSEAPKFAAEQIEFFEKQVRPLLATKCVECHGPKLQEAGLRLDSRRGLLHGMEGSPAAVPGDPSKSRIIAAVKYDGDVQMPPDGKLKDAEVAVLTNWVKLGLPWPEDAPIAGTSAAPSAADAATTAAASPWGGSMDDRVRRARVEHWAFQPVRKPQLPQVDDARWSENPIDRFVLQKLTAAGLQHSPEADRATQIRRLYVDLVGLPPAAEEIDEFVRDASPQAYEKVVDKLLASPRYGERWARHWLDVARYADTKGYAFQQERRYPFAYTYRDYVIRVFNDDLPYDQFIVEQLAADKLPPQPNNRSLAAMGFITCGRQYQGMHDTLDDQIDVVMRGFLGLTASCARCHDHKFDPIPTDDYYSLYGVFRSSTQPAELPQLGEPTPTPEYKAYLEELAKLERARTDYLKEHEAKLADELRRNVRDYLGKVVLERLEKTSTKEFEFIFDAGDPRPQVVTRWRNFLNAGKAKPDALFRAWHAFDRLKEAEFAEQAPSLVAELLKADRIGESNYVNRWIREALKKKSPQRMLDVAQLYGDVFDEAYELHTKKDPRAAEADAAAVLDVLLRAVSPTSLTQDEATAVFDRKTRDGHTKLRSKVESHVAMSPAAPPRAMVLADEPKPYDPRVFLRGDAARPERAVPRQFLRVLAGEDRKPFADGSGRLDLARAIADRNNPLTARVMVNRVWMLHFGRGLVETPSDFGVRTPPPSHPELLDFLAAEFMDEGWSIKRLHRRIVTSQTYRQSSTANAATLTTDRVSGSKASTAESNRAPAVDPDNRLLWRMNRRRLEFEAMRDAMLVAAGTLDEKSFGRPVDLWSTPYTARRSVYGYIDRQDLPGVFGIFDFANPDVTIDQRPRTSVPQQALFAMNSPFVQELSRRTAARAEVTKEKDDRPRAAALMRAVLGRSPTEDEATRLTQFVAAASKAPSPESRSPWQYGTGEIDLKQGRVQSFNPFPFWSGSSWQGGAQTPDDKLSYAMLKAGGGHPGTTARTATILRWVSPVDGRITIGGLLKHPSKEGDGVTAHAVSSRSGTFGKWTAEHHETKTETKSLEVKIGDRIDLVVEPRASHAFDSYQWTPVIHVTSLDNPAQAASVPKLFNSADDFHGPIPPSLTPWEMLAQVLMMSNEFMFVD